MAAVMIPQRTAEHKGESSYDPINKRAVRREAIWWRVEMERSEVAMRRVI
jgi:hypothetical protein